ncbi:cytochrome c peroxidase [Muricoccus pecuniae]|uniref:Methylamine utilization protein MauG n=1 Tax=Muricoccus pecuniae TaxID=693023 RepID=A0A840Y389_9PROT|nr:cytochrome c peroxidase [Roseomonas pecuniae]MBB5694626.1 cytochrome c peroxidase [Roseomonas pecuniae]
MRRAAAWLADGLLAGAALLLLSASLLALAGPAGSADPGSPAESAALRAAYRRPAGLPEGPADNPFTAEKAQLGRRLFFDPSLSASGTMSCASCHQPARGFTDGLSLARGNDGGELRRKSPTLWNLAWAPFLFWDGRAEGLEAQAEAPIEAHEEMGQPLGALVERMGADPAWRAAFATAFPGQARPVTRENLVRAIASWERTLVSPRTRFDAWVEGEEAALTAAERRGLSVFHGPAGCANCHEGWAFTDHAFYDIGLPGGRVPDLGRGPVLGLERADRAFKTPTLREAIRRAPYMHDGSLPTLDAVLDHYEGGVVDRPTLPPELPRRLSLSAGQRADLIAFLGTLTSPPDAPLPEMATPPAAAPAAVASIPPVARARVSQRGRQFAPLRAALTPGGVLEIVNDDTTAHNIRIDAPELTLNSGIQDPGQTVRWRMEKPGRYTAFCGIHPKMRLEIEVAAAR